MTLLKLVIMVKQTFSYADDITICRMTNELEQRIRNDILQPSGIACREENLTADSDMDQALLLSENYASIYLYYIFAGLSLSECDTERYSVYSALFSKEYSKIAADFRKANFPRQKNKYIGGI